MYPALSAFKEAFSLLMAVIQENDTLLRKRPLSFQAVNFMLLIMNSRDDDLN
jgi:hypothetical protein